MKNKTIIDQIKSLMELPPSTEMLHQTDPGETHLYQAG